MIAVWSICGIILLFLIFLVFWRFYFLRDPERSPPKGNCVVSPADGKVISVFGTDEAERIVQKRFLGRIRTLTKEVGDACTIISIFMSPLDVHINRSPITGTVRRITHTPGSFRAVTGIDEGISNEKTELLLDTSIGNVKVIQVAGLIARSIVTWVREKDELQKGERFGLINLGSQLIVIVPDSYVRKDNRKNVRITVSRGDRVRAGESILARY